MEWMGVFGALIGQKHHTTPFPAVSAEWRPACRLLFMDRKDKKDCVSKPLDTFSRAVSPHATSGAEEAEAREQAATCCQMTSAAGLRLIVFVVGKGRLPQLLAWQVFDTLRACQSLTGIRNTLQNASYPVHM